jgi:hypothetical protein
MSDRRLVSAFMIFALIIGLSAKAQNIDSYCKKTNGLAFRAIVLNRNDAYSWRCSDGSSSLGVDVSALCHDQFGSQFNAQLLDRNDAYSWRCAATAAAPASSPAPAQVASDLGCDDGEILGYPPTPSGVSCVQASVSVAPSQYAQTNSPPCPGDISQEVNEFIRDQTSGAASTAAANYAGPLAGFAAKFVAGKAVEQIFSELGWPITNSVCAPLCVKIPAGTTVVRAEGFAQDGVAHAGKRTYCGTGVECGGVGWSAMEPLTQTDDVVCTVAKNWSADRQRTFGLFVYYR